jgi:TolB-like protein
MKHCPACRRTYTDAKLNYCRDDGTTLLTGAVKSGDLPTRPFGGSVQLGVPTTGRLQSVASIAVLPFVNVSAEPDNEYFCDGLAEELLNALARIEGLKVAARTSAFSFKGKDVQVTEIGRVLNVATVLEGSVRKSGHQLRINLQLINAFDGYQLWSERYDRKMENIFDVQDEITLAVVAALKMKLLGEEKVTVLKRYTHNAEAYELYLKGLYEYHSHTAEGWQKAFEYFQKTLEVEPEYAPAYAMTSVCLAFAWYFGWLPTDEAVPKWIAAANRALQIDDNLAEAHASLGNAHCFYEWNWAEAEKDYRHAITLNPNSSDAQLFYGLFLAARERFTEALRAGRRALEVDPLSLFVNMQVGWICLFANKLDETQQRVNKMIEIEPDFDGAYLMAGSLNLVRGKYEQAIEDYEKSLALGGADVVLSMLGAAYGALGTRDKALGTIDQLLKKRKEFYAPAFYIARVYSSIGDTEKTFDWLETAIQERNGELVFLDQERRLGSGNLSGESFRADSRVSERLSEVGLLSSTGSADS